MKLPSLEKSKRQEKSPIIKEKYKIVSEQNKNSPSFISNSLLSRMKEIKEIKIYLKEKFIQKEIDDQFLKDIEKEFAEQYLLKMKIFPTKILIKKVLKLCPLKNCDFQLYDENIFINYNEKNVKSMHIFPVFDKKRQKLKNLELNSINSIKVDKNILGRNDFKTLPDNKTISYNNKKFDHFKFNNFKKSKINKYNHLSIETNPLIKNFFGTDDNFSSKKRMPLFNKNNFRTINTNTNTELLYNREKIDDLFAKYRESVTNMQLFSNNKSKIKINLSPENIRTKYISPESNWSNKAFENKGKLSKISKSILSYKNVLNNEKYFFDLRYIKDLTEEIIKEINEPINPQIELIIKDMNYILDNFPFNEFIHIKNDNDNNNQTINESNELNSNTINYSFTLNKIEVKNNKEYLSILKALNSNESCRIVILCINLIYWIVLGGNRNVQIDANTKELIYLKLMKEWELFSSNFKNRTLFYKIYTPLFIIICRIEIENYFLRKYIYLFEDKNNKNIFFKKANAIISEIFDKHGYMNTFNLLCKKNDEINKKFRINDVGHYKNKLYSTSNFVEMLFRNSDENLKNETEVKERENFIAEHKKKYFSFYLDKMNNNLKRRNLEPIFRIKFKSNGQKEESNISKNIHKKENSDINDDELLFNHS